MSFSVVRYVGDAATRDFPIPFPYLDQSHIRVEVDGIPTEAIGSDYKFSFNNPTNLRVDTVILGDPVPAGFEIKIYRQTPINDLAVVFGAGVSLSSSNLNKNSEYLTYALQEATDNNDEFTEAYLKDFDKRYLGARNVFPTTDNEGNPLQQGAIVWKLGDGRGLYVWDGSGWRAGEVGPEGPAGPIGLQGPQGIQGIDGPEGPRGPQGIQGAQGPQGATGPIGPQGNTGATGLQGDTGLTGPAGTQGIQGPTGLQGPIGPDGGQGPIGPQGPIGDKGPIGDQGPVGLQGTTGDVGPLGPQGAMGATPLGLAFGKFDVNDDGILTIEFYGTASDNDFTIGPDGFLTVSTV